MSSQSESDCECAICGEHYGDRSATWIQCNSCDDWFDHECAGIGDEQLQDTEGDSVLQVLIAFGMGVNPPNVRYVLHCGPHDVESYVQEIGQGARDCGITYATNFYSRAHNILLTRVW